MKWFLIQSLFLALAAFGLGALFHRLLWRKGAGRGSPSPTSVRRFAGNGEVRNDPDRVDASATRTAELAALRAEHDKVVGERDTKIKEFAALSFEHSAAKTALADRDASVESLRSQLDVATAASSAASIETEGLLAQVETHRSTIEELQKQLVSAQGDNDAALATLRTDSDARVGALTAEHDAALAALRVECEGRLGAQKAHDDAALAALRTDHDRVLQEARGERDRTLSGLRGDHEKSLAELRRRAESAEDELTRLTAEHEGCAANLSRLREELDTKQREVHVQSFTAEAGDPGTDDAFEGDHVTADDLSRIEGIGPKISEILMAGGVRTFRRLAAMPQERVRSIVNAGGVSFTPSLGTWAGQAALLRDGDEAGFQAFVDRLVAGSDEAR